jgi:hypothetical protein
MTTTYQKLLNKIEAFCNAHLQIKKYKGEFKEQMPNFATLDEKYPIVFVVPTGDTEGLELNQFTIEVYCLDIIQKDRANINTIVSDCHLILKDLYLYFKDGTDLEVDVIGDPTMTPLNNDLLDYAAGWVMTITFEVEGYTVCAIPMNPIPPFTPICEDASYLVEYVNGTPIESGTIPSGGSATIQVPNPSVCDDATYSITDDDLNVLYSGSIPSGGNLDQLIQDSTVTITDDSLNTLYTLSVNAEGSASQVIQDSTAVLKNTDNTILSTTSINAEASADIVAPDGHVHIKKENDGTIANVFVPSGTTETYDVADNDISVNGVLEFDIHATDPLDIRLRDTTNSVVTPNSVTESGNHAVIVIPDTDIEVNGVAEGSVVASSTVDIQLSDSLGVVTPTSVTQVGNDFQIVLPDAPLAVTRSTATLMKTGQTTSYRTGDDGDLEAGRDTDFLTLDAAPLHNDGTTTLNTTTARFTDTLGGSTYADDIVLDWSTWNGSTLLGYYLGDASNRTWNDYIDWALALSIGTFTTGWRSINVKEMTNLWQYSTNRATNYSPFNGGFFTLNIATSSRFFWTSTTYPTTTANAIRVDLASWALQSTAKTNSNQCIAVRTFSLSLLNVLS